MTQPNNTSTRKSEQKRSERVARSKNIIKALESKYKERTSSMTASHSEKMRCYTL